MYKIDTILFSDYGLQISTHKGQNALLNPKSQFFTVYGNEGFQITKRKGNVLTLVGFILADDITDFIAKTAIIRNLFKAPGIRAIELDNGVLNCFCIDGFKIDKVRAKSSTTFARFSIKLMIV